MADPRYSDKPHGWVHQPLLGVSTRNQTWWLQGSGAILHCLAFSTPNHTPWCPGSTTKDPTFTVTQFLHLVRRRVGNQAWQVYCGFPSCRWVLNHTHFVHSETGLCLLPNPPSRNIFPLF